MKKYSNNSWYSVILAVLMVWFMLILTTWVFNLVFSSSKDTKAMEYYHKAYAWALWAVELGLLKAKQYSYSYSTQEDLKLEWSMRNPDVSISYELDATTDEINSRELKTWEFDIIPLFVLDENKSEQKITNIEVSGLNDNIVWNIVWKNWGISGVWNISNSTEWNYRTILWQNVSFETKNVWEFLSISELNYLILHNVSSSDIYYNIKSLESEEFFTKTNALLIWTWELGEYKQNIRVEIDSWKYLNLLKYSIFSPN